MNDADGELMVRAQNVQVSDHAWFCYSTIFFPDPAYVTDMPPETFLPIGMRGVIRCPIRANPPLLFVSWTKDGLPLHLDKV